MSQSELFEVGPRTPIEPEATARTKRGPCIPAPIGSGPEGETCRTCRHYTLIEYANVYRKCGLMQKHWTKGAGTDIKAGWAACRCWEADE